MESRVKSLYRSIRSRVDLEGTFKNDTDAAKFGEKLESSAIFGAAAGATVRIIISSLGAGKLFPQFFATTAIGAGAGAVYVITVGTVASLTNKDWAWNHLAGGLASGAVIGYAARSPALGRRIGIPLGLVCCLKKSGYMDGYNYRAELKSRPRQFSPWGYRGYDTYEEQPKLNELVDILRNEDDYGKN